MNNSETFLDECISSALKSLPEERPIISPEERQICLDATPPLALLYEQDEGNPRPWFSEPPSDILRYRYLVRSGDAEGNGLHNRVWPASGYVACDKWAAGRSEAAISAAWRVLDLSRSTRDEECGLFGFLDGRIGGRYFDPGSALGKTMQIITVDLAEVEQMFDLWEHRVPRGWVKFNGTLEDGMALLLREGTAYSSLVHCNIRIGMFAMQKMLRDPHRDEVFLTREEMGSLRAEFH